MRRPRSTTFDNISVYFPGARIGAALFVDDDGKRHWRYRQFEVIDDRVQLQEINEASFLACNREPLVTGIPDSFDGVEFSDFAAAVRNANRPLTTEEADAITARGHERWVASFGREDVKRANGTYCRGPAFVDDDDPSVPNDPDFAP